MACPCTCTDITTDPGCPQHGNKEALAPDVVVVTYEWANWSRNVFAFGSMEAAVRHVLAAAKENNTEFDGTGDLQAGLDAINAIGASCEVDALPILT